MKQSRLIIVLVSSFMFAYGPTLAQENLTIEVQSQIAKARAGDVQSQILVAAAYDYGRGAPRDRKEAMKWYLVAANHGNAEAQNSVGSMLQEDKKYGEAIQWYEKASSSKHAGAINSLAYLHDLGLGVPQNRKKAVELYLKAADLGSAEAMWNLANVYGAGQIGEPDLLMACIWVSRAKKYAKVHEKKILAHVERVLPRLEKMLTGEQVANCKEQGASWTPSAQQTR